MQAIAEATSAAESRQLLRRAVKFAPKGSTKGLLENLFSVWFDGMVYNQIWEDPDIDAEALALGPSSRILTIMSAGCNTLNYLVHDVEHVDAVDLNRHHLFLTRLKLAAVGNLPDHEALFRFFAHADDRRNLAAYKEFIAPKLDSATRAYWDGGVLRRGMRLNRIKAFSRGFYNSSRLGQFLRIVHKICRLAGRRPEEMLSIRDPKARAAYFDKNIGPLFDLRLVKWGSKMPLSVYNLGIPPSQYELLKEDCNGDLLALYRERARRLVCDYPIEDNYFAWQALCRKYDTKDQRAVPPYLRAENYQIVKSRVGRIRTRLISTIDALAAAEPGRYNACIFLDSQDWMPPEVITTQWTQIARVAPVGSRIIFRTAGRNSPLETSLPPELLARFGHDAALSREYFRRDRSAIYGGFHLYTIER
jgi:S-adenosylmethionine-diacylglycerol 3-amino-3-carboxypropyl transferase